ncbi:MAG TPA: antibiotic biosynthesis monooxygenase [Solirubrobacteraceae bacterium]|nr:antibiotic biosynthesis monooxygenase [Solirubrobacteraceae bacterium]
MYISLSSLRVPVDRAPELVAAFRARAHRVDGHDGFLDLQVWQSDRDPGELLMVSRWRDRDCFKAYMKSADHRLSHSRIEPSLGSEVKLERLEHLHTYQVVAE